MKPTGPAIRCRSGDLEGRGAAMTQGPETHTCPYCDLVFTYHGEVVDHIRNDHPGHADSVAGIEPRELPHD